MLPSKYFSRALATVHGIAALVATITASLYQNHAGLVALILSITGCTASALYHANKGGEPAR